ncbi:hypothetical protein GCM10023324_03710 [Streptomyces youssoufiensis]
MQWPGQGVVVRGANGREERVVRRPPRGAIRARGGGRRVDDVADECRLRGGGERWATGPGGSRAPGGCPPLVLAPVRGAGAGAAGHRADLSSGLPAPGVTDPGRGFREVRGVLRRGRRAVASARRR